MLNLTPFLHKQYVRQYSYDIRSPNERKYYIPLQIYIQAAARYEIGKIWNVLQVATQEGIQKGYTIGKYSMVGTEKDELYYVSESLILIRKESQSGFSLMSRADCNLAPLCFVSKRSPQTRRPHSERIFVTTKLIFVNFNAPIRSLRI